MANTNAPARIWKLEALLDRIAQRAPLLRSTRAAASNERELQRDQGRVTREPIATVTAAAPMPASTPFAPVTPSASQGAPGPRRTVSSPGIAAQNPAPFPAPTASQPYTSPAPTATAPAAPPGPRSTVSSPNLVAQRPSMPSMPRNTLSSPSIPSQRPSMPRSTVSSPNLAAFTPAGATAPGPVRRQSVPDMRVETTGTALPPGASAAKGNELPPAHLRAASLTMPAVRMTRSVPPPSTQNFPAVTAPSTIAPASSQSPSSMPPPPHDDLPDFDLLETATAPAAAPATAATSSSSSIAPPSSSMASALADAVASAAAGVATVLATGMAAASAAVHSFGGEISTTDEATASYGTAPLPAVDPIATVPGEPARPASFRGLLARALALRVG